MTTSLSILIIVKSLPWKFKGGIQTHSWDLARALSQKGHRVTILTGGAFLSKETSSEQEGIELIEIPFFPGRYIPGISYLAEELAFNLQVKTWVKRNQDGFDVIHAQGRSGYLLYQLPEIQHKLVQTIHGNTGTEASSDFRNINAKVHAFFAQIWEKKSLQHVRKTIAVSQDLKNSVGKIKSLVPSSIEVIPNGVGINDISTAQTTIGMRVDRFVFVGRLHPVKGLIPLIQALKNADKKIFLDIIGDGPQRTELEELIQALDLTDQVRLLGAYTNSSVQFLLPHYTGLVLPSVYESQGIVLLEANLKGIPVVASDLPSIRESIIHGKNGLLCDLNRPEEFVQALIYLQENPREAKNMGLIGQAWVKENYNWSKIADLTINLYHQLAS